MGGRRAHVTRKWRAWPGEALLDVASSKPAAAGREGEQDGREGAPSGTGEPWTLAPATEAEEGNPEDYPTGPGG